MTATIYTPEMNEARPADTQIDARIGHYGDWYLTTPLVLKGRGIKFLKTLRSEELTEKGQYRVGQHEYKVTDLAFSKLETIYKISVDNPLN